MIVNCKIDLTNDWRMLLASHIAGKIVRRMATRNEVREFVAGCIDAACTDGGLAREHPLVADARSLTMPVGSNLTEDEQQEVAQLKKEGKSASYIVGWLIVGRGAGSPRPRLGS